MAGKSASQVPISKHPAFPAIVALWFAALLGIGSLVLPVSLFETAIGASGLAGVLPAAEPPLGVSARILIAIVAATLGVIAGLAIARKVAAAQGHATRAPRRAPRAPAEASSAKRPISAHEELWSEGFDEPVEDAPAAPVAGRRRALSVTDESGPSELLHSAPLPGAETEIVLAEAPMAAPAEATAADDDALELAAFAESEDVESDFPREEPVACVRAAHADDAGDSELVAEATPEPAVLEPVAEPPVVCDAARPFDAPLDTSASVAEASPTDQLRREIAAEQSQAHAAASAPFAASAPPIESLESTDAHDDIADREGAAIPESEPVPAPAGARQSALDELSISELVERFTQSLRHAAERAETEAGAPAPAESVAEAGHPPRSVPDLGAGAVEAPRFAPPAEPEAGAVEESTDEPAPERDGEPAIHVPGALRPVAFGGDYADEEDREDGDDLPLTLSFEPESRPFDRPLATPAPATAESTDDATDESDHGYSSLLNMRKQVSSREFVRIEDEMPAADAAADEAIEPVVVFPGQEQRRAAPPADRAPADRSSIGRLPDGGAAETAGVERPFAAPASIRSASDPMQTERALREALHKLQRLSGAA